MINHEPGGTANAWDPNLDQRYRDAVEQWLQLDSPAEIQSVYDRVVFPLALARMERDAAARPASALLILPVGTQPYSPRLVAAGIPAAAAGLISTSDSLPIARDLEILLAARGIRTDLRVSETGGVSRPEVAELVTRIYRTAGEPPPEATIVDLTSGRKPTVAAMASVADTLGATSCYLEAKFHRHPHGGYATGERLVLDGPLSLASVIASVQAARALARAGLLREAARHLSALQSSRYLPPRARAAQHLFNASAAVLEGRATAAAAAYRRALRQLPPRSHLTTTLQEAWRNGWSELARGDRSALAACHAELLRLLPRGVPPPHDSADHPFRSRPPLRLRRAVRPVFQWLFGVADDQ